MFLLPCFTKNANNTPNMRKRQDPSFKTRLKVIRDGVHVYFIQVRLPLTSLSSLPSPLFRLLSLPPLSLLLSHAVAGQCRVPLPLRLLYARRGFPLPRSPEKKMWMELKLVSERLRTKRADRAAGALLLLPAVAYAGGRGALSALALSRSLSLCLLLACLGFSGLGQGQPDSETPARRLPSNFI